MYFRANLANTMLKQQNQRKNKFQNQTDSIGELPYLLYKCQANNIFSLEYLNQGCKSISGYTNSELSNKNLNFSSLILKIDKAKVIDEIENAIKHKESFNIEYRILTKEGEVKWIFDQGKGVYNYDGELVYIEGIIVKSPNQQIADKNLLVDGSLSILKDIEEIVGSDKLIVLKWKNEAGWPIEFVSGNIAETLGYQPSEVYCGQLKNIDLIHPEDYSLVKKIAIANQSDKKNELSLQLRIKAKWGEYKWFEAYLKLLPFNEFFTYAILIDISDKKLSEEITDFNENLLNAILNTGPDALILIDPSTKRITKCNTPTFKLFGFDSEQDLIGTNILSLQKYKPEKELHQSLNESLELTGLWTDTIECINKKTGAFLGKFVIRRFTLRNKTYELVHISDITENVRNLSTIKDYAEKLKSLNSTKDKLFSIIAHDLKSPFNAIVGFSSILTGCVKDYNPDQIEKYVGLIHEASNRIFQLLENLLEWSRSQTGQIGFNPAYFRICPIIEDQIKLFANILSEKQLQVNTEYNDILVYADINMLRVIIRNLISNAIKFSNPNSQIVVQIYEDSLSTIIQVIDYGVGLDKTSQQNLFNSNHMVTKTGTIGEKGTGLGLMLCKEFIERHNGQMSIKSSVGKGTQIKVTLPLNYS